MRVHSHLSRQRTWLQLFILAASVFFASLASGDTVIVPNNVANSDVPFGSGVLRAANYHQQTVYGSNHFPANLSLLITELRYRPDSYYGSAFTTTVANIRFNLSTTTRRPDALNAAFAENVGNDNTIVFNGPLSISSRFTGPVNGPKDFDIVVPLTTPFLYNPAMGNLLVEVRNFSGSPVVIKVGGENIAADNASRLGGVIGAATGGASTDSDAMQIIYVPTNQSPVVSVTRGPYLQNGTTSNLVVRWRTSQPTNGVVRFGLTNAALNWAVTNYTLTNDQAVTLTNLRPNTKYFYSIGAAGTNFVPGTNFFFVTAPAIPKPVRIWATGDFGTTGVYGDGALSVRDAYETFTGDRYTDIWLMLGDNAYQYGTDDDYQRAVFDVYQSMLEHTVAWSTIGNHETYGSNALGHIAYYDIFTLPQNGEAGGVPSGTIHYYSFDYANIHFVCLDSELSDQTPGGSMATWLQEDLAANTNEWVIAFWHSPPYTKGSHDSDSDIDTDGHLKNMREVFVPILEAFNVDLVLSGHSHNYERSYVLNGHYGKSWTLDPAMIANSGSGREDDGGAYLKFGGEAGRGTVYVVAGSSGFATFQVGRHPVMYAALLEIGSFVIDVDSNRLDAKFVSGTGMVDDYFTIRKAPPVPLPSIERIAAEAGFLTLHFTSIAGQQYQVMHATQLSPPNWQPVSAVITATGPMSDWTSAVPQSGNHFYKIALLPNLP
jgi:hypothetical protein